MIKLPLFESIFDNPSLWNHPFEYTRAEQKRNKLDRTKGRVWKERKKERRVRGKERTFAAFIGRSPPIPRGGTLVFTRVRERDLSVPWEHEKCRSQPTSFWFTVDERQTEREIEREREREEGVERLFWSVETHRSRLSLFRDGGSPTHLLRLLFVAASSPVKTN